MNAQPQPSGAKPLYKRTWFKITAAVVLVLLVLGIATLMARQLKAHAAEDAGMKACTEGILAESEDPVEAKVTSMISGELEHDKSMKYPYKYMSTGEADFPTDSGTVRHVYWSCDIRIDGDEVMAENFIVDADQIAWADADLAYRQSPEFAELEGN